MSSFTLGVFNRFGTFACLVGFLTLLAASPAKGQDWPALRGADGLGSLTTNGILSRTSQVDLKTRWKKDLGSGYSSVIVASERVVAMYSGKNDDQLACLNASDGETLWKIPIGPVFPGENGSFDGPLSTPLVHQGNIFALSPRGRLLCVRLEDGEIVWSRELVDEEKAILPMYGFTTSPILVDGVLILQLGAKDKSLAGLDPKTGKTLWTAGDDRINSQSPIVVEFQGKKLVLATGGKNLLGVDPSNGDIRLQYEHKGGNGSAMVPVPIGNDQILLTLDDRYSISVRLQPGDGDKIQGSEAWKNRSIKNTYNVPSLSDGNVYAYSTRILTCVDPETGKPKWKNRDPGDGFLITVDNHLIINTKKGGLHLAKASPDGYQEIAQLKIFDKLVWSIPAYSQDAIYVRSLGEIACVDIVPRPNSTAVAESETALPLGPKFAAFIKQADATADDHAKGRVVDDFLEAQTSFPIVEDDIVHFVYRGDGTDIAVAGDMFGARQEKKMTRLAGTDFFYHAMKLPADQRVNYVFLIDYQPQLDPRNSNTTTSSMYAGEMEFAVRLRGVEPLKMSWFGMSEWKTPNHLIESEKPMKGSIVKHSVDSKLLETAMPMEVYLPPGCPEKVAGDSPRFPVVYVFDGPNARKLGQLAKAADRIYRNSESNDSQPAILVFVGGRPTPKFLEAFTKEIVPSIDKNFATQSDRDSRSCVAFGFSASLAMMAVGTNPDMFSGVSVQSPLIFDAAQKQVLGALGKVDQPVRVYIDWGRFDMYNPHENWDLRSISKSLHDELKKNENLTVSGGMVNDSTDWSSWRNRYDQMLSAMVPKSE